MAEQSLARRLLEAAGNDAEDLRGLQALTLVPLELSLIERS